MRNTLISGMLVFIIVICSAALIVTSSLNDSPGFDEPEHITAGYDYVTRHTYWINVYHPPLVKDLAGLAVVQSGAQPVNETLGYKNYRSYDVINSFLWGQDADKILQFARAPLIGLSLAFLVYFFIRIKHEFGTIAGLIALSMLAFCPAFLANARFVATDVMASASFFICLFCLFDYLRRPGLKSAVALGIATGLALLVKMSLVILLPLYAILSLVFIFCNESIDGKRLFPIELKRLKTSAAHCLLASGLALALLYSGYAINMTKLYPHFSWYNFRHFKDLRFDRRYDIMQLTQEQPALRPISWYLTGLFAQSHHMEGGHDKPSFLQGRLYRGGSVWFFPIVMLAKEPIGFLCLMLCAFLSSIPAINRCLLAENSEAVKRTVVNNFVVLGSIFFVIAYLFIAMRSGLNIGVRHIFPVVPFIYMLCAIGITRSPFPKKIMVAIVSVCLLAGVASSLLAYPGHLAYFNELAGGKQAGMKIAIDSNYDWGTDLKRLKNYVEENKIDRIHIAYFGRSKPEYYLGKKYERWPMTERLAEGDYLAVSVQIVQESIAFNGISDLPSPLKWAGPKEAHPDVIEWLTTLQPCGQAGDSILIYKIPK